MKSIMWAIAILSIMAFGGFSTKAADEHAKKGPEQTEAELKKSNLPIEVTKDGKRSTEPQKGKNAKAQSEDAKPTEAAKPAKPQTSASEMAMRHLKLSITLREGKNFVEAFNYLNKAYKHFKKSGNRYWVAACYENFGYLYRDLDSLDLAYAFLREARNIYTKLMRGDKGSASAVADILGIPDDERHLVAKEKKPKKMKYDKAEKKSKQTKGVSNPKSQRHDAGLEDEINQLGENDVELLGMIKKTNSRLDALDADMLYIKESLEVISRKLDHK